MSLGKAYNTQTEEYDDQKGTGLKFDMVQYMINDELKSVPDSFVAHRKRVANAVVTALQRSKSNTPSLLEIGCGIGSDLRRFKKALAGSDATFTGVDIMPKLLEVGESMGPGGAKYLEGDLHSIPAPENSFDVVYCSRLLIHSTNLEKALQEFMRVLKTGGTGIAVEAEMTKEGYGPLLCADPIVRKVENQKLTAVSQHFANVAAASTTLAVLKTLENAGKVKDITIDSLTSCVTDPQILDPALEMSTQLIAKLVQENKISKKEGDHYLTHVRQSASTGKYILNSTLYCISWKKN